YSLSFQCAATLRNLPSFPTQRSSDLMLIDANGNVIEDGTSDPSLAQEHFDVPPPPERGPNFSVLPAQKHHVANGSELLYVTVPMPTLVRNQQAGINAIVVALPEAQARDVFRDLTP